MLLFRPASWTKPYRALFFCLLFAAIYVCTDVALNLFSFSVGFTIIWPLNGVTIAILLRRKRSDWPAILLGVALGTGIGECLDHNTYGLEVCLRIVSVTEVLLSALVLPAFTNLDQWLRKPKVFHRFAAALVLGPGVSGIMAAILHHVVQHQPYLLAFDQWATADALGIAATMPLALALTSTEMRDLFRPHALPKTVGTLFAAFILITLSLSITGYPLLFLIYPILLAVDLILSFSGSAIAVTLFCLVSVYLTMHGHGAFGVWPQTHFISSSIALQAFLGFNVLALFPASLVLRERRRLISDLNSSNAQLLMLASRDGLTGLFNRRALDEQLTQEWKRAARLKTALAVIMIDVDLFKQFNDLYGHNAGDDCLRIVAQTIADTARRAQDHVSRFGGEEFVVLLPHTGLLGAEHLAEKIRNAVSSLQIAHEGSPWKCVTLSIGCSCQIPSLDGHETDLLDHADAALYQAKRAGRNCVVRHEIAPGVNDSCESLAPAEFR